MNDIYVLFSVVFRLLRKTGQWAACAAAFALVCALPARADQIAQHDNLASRFVSDMHADPLVADCAAHGSFIASTANVFDRVDFPATSFDSAHSSVSPWNAPFDQKGKQRTQVDTVVTVEGTGISRSGGQTDLRFRCGYVGSQMLAFSWNNPVAPAAAKRGRATVPAAPALAAASGERSSYTYRYRGHGRHRHMVRVERRHTQRATRHDARRDVHHDTRHDARHGHETRREARRDTHREARHDARHEARHGRHAEGKATKKTVHGGNGKVGAASGKTHHGARKAASGKKKKARR